MNEDDKLDDEIIEDPIDDKVHDPKPEDKPADKPDDKAKVDKGPATMQEALDASFRETARKAGKEIPETDAEKAAKAKPAEPAKEPAKKAAPEGEKEPAKDAAKPDAKKEPKKDDPKLAEMPDGLTQPAQERFKALASKVKEQGEELTKVSGQAQQLEGLLNGFREQFKETQTTPEDLDRFMTFNKAFKTGDYGTAFKIVEEQYKAIAKLVGKVLPTYDLLEEFPDLKKQVDEFKLTPEAAHELASRRRTEAVQADRQKQADATKQQQQNTEQRDQQAIDAGLAEIGEWTKGLMSSDLDYKIKEGKLLPLVDDVVANYRPDQWVKTLKLAYDNITVEREPSKGNGITRPLRGGSGPSGSQADPKSMYEAIWGAKG